jgi:hypothetical protein
MLVIQLMFVGQMVNWNIREKVHNHYSPWSSVSVNCATLDRLTLFGNKDELWYLLRFFSYSSSQEQKK